MSPVYESGIPDLLAEPGPAKKWKKYFDVQGIFNPEPLVDFVQQSITLVLDRHFDTKAYAQTKNFRIWNANGIGSVKFKNITEESGETHTLKNYWDVDQSNFVGQITAIPGTDKIICSEVLVDFVSDEDNSVVICYLVDLEVVHGRTEKIPGKTASLELVRLETTGVISSWLSSQGLLSSIDEQDIQLHVSYFRHPLLTLEMVSTLCLRLTLQVPSWIEDWKPNVMESLISRNMSEVYISCQVTDQWGYVSGLWVCLIKKALNSDSLTLQHQQFIRLHEDSQNCTLMWVEVKEHRVFACAFTPDCRLWAFMYWRGSFVCAGRQKKHTNGSFDMSSRFSSFIRIQNIERTQSVVGCHIPDLRTDGPFVYRFTHIGLKW